jgi:hypothetical protein
MHAHFLISLIILNLGRIIQDVLQLDQMLKEVTRITYVIHGHSSRLPDMTRHLPASRAATMAGVCWGRQLG